jgi:hypothetical protein
MQSGTLVPCYSNLQNCCRIVSAEIDGTTFVSYITIAIKGHRLSLPAVLQTAAQCFAGWLSMCKVEALYLGFHQLVEVVIVLQMSQMVKCVIYHEAEPVST